MMPEYGLGFWQCKLRYRTQERAAAASRANTSKRGLPMDVIVVDFFHWPHIRAIGSFDHGLLARSRRRWSRS